MHSRLLASVLALPLASMQPPAPAQQRPAILDMHLHAVRADQQAPPSQGMCTPLSSQA
jgi:hypothetical protein